MLTIIIFLVINHMLGDFVLQTRFITSLRFPVYLKCATTKNLKLIRKGTLLHTLIHFILYVLISWPLLNYLCCLAPINHISSINRIRTVTFLLGVIYAAFHFVIDLAKSCYCYFRKQPSNHLFVFLIDQLLHILMIVVLALITSHCLPVRLTFNRKNPVMRYAAFVSVVLVCLLFFAYLINSITEYIKSQASKRYSHCTMEPSSDDIYCSGLLIGIIERALILTAVCIDQYAIIGFLYASKSVARFNEFKNKQFAEYFIIGNLLSFLSALLCGLLARWILTAG